MRSYFINVSNFRDVLLVLLKVTYLSLRLTYDLVLPIDFLKLFCHLQCPIWASVVNNNYLVVKPTAKKQKNKNKRQMKYKNTAAISKLNITLTALIFLKSYTDPLKPSS